MFARLLSVGIVVLGASLATASELPVTYTVQDKPLRKSGIAGTPLTFTLFSDSACTQQVYQAVVPIENVELISRLKLLTPKGAVKGPKTDELRTTLSGVNPPAQSYLKVTGAGVTASGEDCQLQASLKTSAPSAVWKDANGALIGPLTFIPYYANLFGNSFVLYPVPGTVVVVPINFSGFPATPEACLYYTSSDCSGDPLMGGPPPFIARQVGSTIYFPSPGATQSPSAFHSSDCGTCTAYDGSVMIGPSDSVSLKAFTPPFHLELQ
jgi:hypothetical protein